MAESSLYRILDTGVKEDVWLLNQVIETDGGCESGQGDPVTVSVDGEADVGQVIEYVDPGHLISANVNHETDPATITGIEHRGGLTLERLSPRTSIEFVDRFWESVVEQHESVPDSPGIGGIRTLSSQEDPLADEDIVGEIFVMEAIETDNSTTWEEFVSGPLSEQVYGAFKELDGSPAEVLAGNPAHTDYWYALLFDQERTELARKIRVKFGIPYAGDEYRAHPDINIDSAIDHEKIPADLDDNSVSLISDRFAETYAEIPFPEKMGQGTIDLVGEFLVMGAELDLISVLTQDDLEDYSLDELRDQTLPLLTAFTSHAELLLDVHDTIVDHPEETIDALITAGKLPEAERLDIFKEKFDQRLQLHRAYIDKLETITLDEYIIAPLRQVSQSKREEMGQEVGKEELEPLPEEMNSTIRIHKALVKRLESYSESADQLVKTVDQSDGSYTYELVGDEGRFTEIAETRETVHSAILKSNHYTQVASRLHARFKFADSVSLHGEFGDLMEVAHEAAFNTPRP